MNTILAIFREVRDPRAPNARHPLATILMLAFCATLCGCQNCVEFAEFCEDSQDTLAEFIDLPHGTPSHDCFSRTLRLLDPAELQRALLRILAGLREGLALPAPSGVVAVDGKRLKRAYEHGRAFAPPLMVSVWDAQTRLSLAAVPAPAGNEVAGVLNALASLDLTGCVVTADALHCHPAMARTVQAHGAEYALCIKGNHGPLLAFTEQAFAQAEVGGHPPFSEHHDQGHGRREWRCASVIPVPEGAPDFPGADGAGPDRGGAGDRRQARAQHALRGAVAGHGPGRPAGCRAVALGRRERPALAAGRRVPRGYGTITQRSCSRQSGDPPSSCAQYSARSSRRSHSQAKDAKGRQ